MEEIMLITLVVSFLGFVIAWFVWGMEIRIAFYSGFNGGFEGEEEREEYWIQKRKRYYTVKLVIVLIGGVLSLFGIPVGYGIVAGFFTAGAMSEFIWLMGMNGK